MSVVARLLLSNAMRHITPSTPALPRGATAHVSRTSRGERGKLRDGSCHRQLMAHGPPMGQAIIRLIAHSVRECSGDDTRNPRNIVA